MEKSKKSEGKRNVRSIQNLRTCQKSEKSGQEQYMTIKKVSIVIALKAIKLVQYYRQFCRNVFQVDLIWGYIYVAFICVFQMYKQVVAEQVDSSSSRDRRNLPINTSQISQNNNLITESFTELNLLLHPFLKPFFKSFPQLLSSFPLTHV